MEVVRHMGRCTRRSQGMCGGRRGAERRGLERGLRPQQESKGVKQLICLACLPAFLHLGHKCGLVSLASLAALSHTVAACERSAAALAALYSTHQPPNRCHDESSDCKATEESSMLNKAEDSPDSNTFAGRNARCFL